MEFLTESVSPNNFGCGEFEWIIGDWFNILTLKLYEFELLFWYILSCPVQGLLNLLELGDIVQIILSKPRIGAKLDSTLVTCPNLPDKVVPSTNQFYLVLDSIDRFPYVLSQAMSNCLYKYSASLFALKEKIRLVFSFRSKVFHWWSLRSCPLLLSPSSSHPLQSQPHCGFASPMSSHSLSLQNQNFSSFAWKSNLLEVFLKALYMISLNLP